MAMVAVNDSFSESGTPAAQIEKVGLIGNRIVAKVCKSF